MTTRTSRRGAGAAPAVIGVLMVLCCIAGPAVIGAVAGSVIGGWLGIAGALAVAGALAWRSRAHGRAC
jgi:hypothetical protein